MWPYTLDVSALIARGWHPVPFREFIVKVHSRCDLSCDYCYIYEMADQSWRAQPRRMSPEIAEMTAQRIGEHARAHRLHDVALVLHGGEPLLAGQDLIWSLVEATRKAAGPEVNVAAHVQTNAVGLTDAYLRLFAELELRVGVSLDGTREQHNRHRRFASGRGSYAAAAAGLQRLRQQQYRHLFSGILCTIDLRNDPVTAYEALLAFEPPRIDFLLPHATWDELPPGRTREAHETPYADWLTAIFDRWYHDPISDIRLFTEIIRLILTGTSSGEMVGLEPSTVVVIETDGSVEQVDSLKAAYQGAAGTGLHILRDDLDTALMLPGIVARQLGEQALAAQCRRCPVHRICGGGLYSHRYRTGNGFANPSVYCADLLRLINHIIDVIQGDLDSRRYNQHRMKLW
jgi:uncharacterized protein